jgi:hypothetical protein
MAQTPAGSPNWPELAAKSTAAVVCVIDDVSLVLRSDREISKAKPLPNGQTRVELQNPAEYVLGRLARVKITEVIKDDGNVKVDRTVNIFLPGFLPTEGQPGLVQGQTYLLFLSTLSLSKTLSAAIVHTGTEPAMNITFPAKNKYSITGDAHGVVHLTPETNSVVAEVKALIRKH